MVAINHPKERGIEPESIEMFLISETGVEHIKTLSSSLLESPNDLVLVAEDKLYWVMTVCLIQTSVHLKKFNNNLEDLIQQSFFMMASI